MFKAALRHIIWAVRINRRLWDLELKHLAPPEQFEALPHGALLADASARVALANAAAKAMLDAGDGIVLRNGRLAAIARQLLGSGCGLVVKAGCLHSTDGSDTIQGLIASCAHKILTPHGPGGEMSICLDHRQSLRVTVTPLRATGTVAELPWLGLLIPAAIVTVSTFPTEISLI